MGQFKPCTLGKRLRSIEAEGFVLTEAVNRAFTRLPAHAHELASITFVLKGSCIEMVGKHSFECGPYSTIIKPAGEIHSNLYDSGGARCLIIEAKPRRLQSIQSFSQVLDNVIHLKSGALTPFALRIYKEFNVGDSASLLSIEGLVLEALGQTTRRTSKSPSGAPPRWLANVKEICNEQFDQPISLAGIAKAIEIHPSHLARMFRRYYQCTVGEYVRRLRLDNAMRQLIQSNKSLADIAAASGFYDQSHFTHAFKLHTGLTPTAYRSETKKRKSNTN